MKDTDTAPVAEGKPVGGHCFALNLLRHWPRSEHYIELDFQQAVWFVRQAGMVPIYGGRLLFAVDPRVAHRARIRSAPIKP